MRRIHRQAEEIVSDYSTKRWVGANRRFNREKHGKGCGCLSCAHRVVRNRNEWDEFVSKGNSPVKGEVCFVNGRPKIRSVPNPDFKKK